MSTKYKMNDPAGLYFLSTAVVYWIDVFTRKEYCDIVLASLNYCVNKKGLIVYGFVIMPSHIHLIIGRREGGDEFSAIIRDFKKFTAAKILRAIEENPQESRKEWVLWMMERAGRKNGNNTKYQFWQQDNHPVELAGDWIEQKLHYVHDNPVVSGMVREPEDYVYSSASNYAGKVGLMKVVSVYDGVEI
jgi:putative transposase